MTKNLKVLQVIDSLAVGGAEMMAVNIANAIHSKSVESHLCVTRAEGLLKEKINKEVGYFFLNKQNSFDVKALFKLKKYITENNISILHVHSTSVFFCFLMRLINVKSTKYIWHNHTGANTELTKGTKFKVLKYILKSYKYIINASLDLDTWSKLYLQFKESQFLPNFPISNQEKRTDLKLKSTKKIIILAALRKEKDHINLIKAFKKIRNQYEDWTLHIVGKIYNDLNYETLKKYIIKNNIENKVFFYNTILDTSYVLSQADIGILSSYSEGLPVSLLEYGLAGLPVIVTDVGECKEVVNNFGLVVPKENTGALVNAIKHYIENENLRKLNAKQFQKHIFENYSEDSYLLKLLNIYKTC